MSHGGAALRSTFAKPLRLGGALAAALTFGGLGAEAAAQQITPLMQPPPNDVRLGPSSRYSSPDGHIRFVFDRSGRTALIRFDNDPEVHVLRASGGGGGVEVYRNDANDIVLRVAPYGGVTVYLRGNRNGAAVAEEARAEPLTPQAYAIAQYQARMRALQAAAARQLGRNIVFEAPGDASGIGAGLIIDAAERAAAGLIAARDTQVNRIIVRVGRQPVAQRQGATLAVMVAPQLGFEGRPSSRAIRAVVTGERVGPNP
ncbi:MAG: DUF4908 domain-containing protein [Hyphomonadaceae bacterium]